MKKNNELALRVAYYLSKYDKKAYASLGFSSSTRAHEEIGKTLSINPNSVKNMRDEFDAIHPNSRRGWHQRDLRPSRKKVAEMFEKLSEKELHNVVVGILSRDDFPIEVYSWEVLNEDVAIKSVDKSCIEHNGTGVPQEILFFFNAEGLNGKRDIELLCRGDSVPAQLRTTNARLRIFWPKRFSNILEECLPNNRSPGAYGLGMRLSKLNGNATRFDVQLIEEVRVTSDAQDTDDHPHQGSTEGRKRSYYGTRYERDPRNRKRALEIHGCVCRACGFDFGNFYGQRGVGYIEIHHTKPLVEESSEIYVDPQNDLIPLCANCHRIVHRFRDDVLSLDELKKLIPKDLRSSR